MYPFVLHSLALSLFSSVIGPFGGFFASGFKRAFKIKDFGDVIPGSRGHYGPLRLSVPDGHVR